MPFLNLLLATFKKLAAILTISMSITEAYKEFDTYLIAKNSVPLSFTFDICNWLIWIIKQRH